MARASAEQGDSLFNVRDNSDLARLDDDESEGEVGQTEVVLLAVRTLTILLLIGGSALLTFKVGPVGSQDDPVTGVEEGQGKLEGSRSRRVHTDYLAGEPSHLRKDKLDNLSVTMDGTI